MIRPPRFDCLNCSKRISTLRPVKLFCSDLCKDEADYVRYYRRCLADGRTDQEDVQFALRTKRAFFLSGGYDAKGRRLSSQIREAVIAKFKGRCALCGNAGVEIDHINGLSNVLSNLQLLCTSCHTQKTEAGFILITPDDPRYEELTNKTNELNGRVHSKDPILDCDNDKIWNLKYRQLLNERKQQYYEWILRVILPKARKGMSPIKLTLMLNEKQIPTFHALGKWDRKVVSKILKMDAPT